MKYGERLKMAMDHRSDAIGRKVTRLDVARVANCSPQNIGMIINDSKNKDQKLQTQSHNEVAALLKVNSQWLLDETGPMEYVSNVSAPEELTAAAIEIAVLFDMIPVADKIRRAQAFNLSTDAIISVLQSSASSRPQSEDRKK
jgi:hypothetical protein